MRKSKRGHSGGKQMGNERKRKFLSLLGLVALAAFVVMLIFPSGKSDVGKHGKSVSGNPTEAVDVEAAVIYLDNSASMEGYVHGNDYMDALADLMSIYPKTKVRCTNDSLEITTASELVDKLTRNQINYKGQSLLNKDLEKIVAQVSAKGCKKIAFFVTDGIMSGSDADISQSKKAGHKYNIDHKQDLMNDISKVFRAKNIGAVVYRMRSRFSGQYYCYDNSHRHINAMRSYYVIALGVPGVVADFKQKLIERQKQPIFKFRQEQELDFIESIPMSQNMSVTGGDANRGAVTLAIDSDMITVDVQKVKKAAKHGEPVLNFMINEETFKNYQLKAEELASHLKVSVDGTSRKIEARWDSTRKCISFQVQLNSLSMPSSGNKVRVYIPYFTPSWINSPMVTNDNDSYIINGMPDESTFLFAYFINGIKNNGILKETGFSIYDKTIVLKRK